MAEALQAQNFQSFITKAKRYSLKVLLKQQGRYRLKVLFERQGRYKLKISRLSISAGVLQAQSLSETSRSHSLTVLVKRQGR